MPDTGFTHVALLVSDLDASIAFYSKYAQMEVVHRREQGLNSEREIGWLSDLTRPFVLVLVESDDIEHALGPFAHLGVACATRGQVDQLCELARVEGRLRDTPSGGDGPAGYYGNLNDPDGHTLELSYGQKIGLTLERIGDNAKTKKIRTDW